MIFIINVTVKKDDRQGGEWRKQKRRMGETHPSVFVMFSCFPRFREGPDVPGEGQGQANCRGEPEIHFSRHGRRWAQAIKAAGPL